MSVYFLFILLERLESIGFLVSVEVPYFPVASRQQLSVCIFC